MVALIGSEKQIEWAEKIRAGYVTDTEKWLAKTFAAATKAGQLAETHAYLDPIVERLWQHTQASWWIDRRGETPRAILLVTEKEAQ